MAHIGTVEYELKQKYYKNLKNKNLDLWNYLRRKLTFVGDNNKTAKDIFNKVTKDWE